MSQGRRILQATTVLLIAWLSGACAFPKPEAQMPKDENFVAALSGEMPPPIDKVSRHSWIVTHQAGARTYQRFEMGGGSSTDPYDDFAQGDVMLHGVVKLSDQRLLEVRTCLAKAKDAYHEEFPHYLPIPGPNSNTLVAYLLRTCSIHIELPSTAIGRDYVGLLGAQITEAGTGVQLGTWALGLRLGLQEGVEMQLFGLPFGVHFWPPGVSVPVNPGRIGFQTDGHRDKQCQLNCNEHGSKRAPDVAVGSVTMSAEGGTTVKPERAGNLGQMLTVGLSARGVYGGRLGYGFGLEFDVGAAYPLGFAGMIHAFPLGIGYTVSPTGFIGVFSGIGTSGVSNAVPAGLDFPQELRAEFNVGHVARISLTARGTFIALREARRQGQFGFHETQFGAFARFGHQRGYDNTSYTSGTFFGLERREIMGSPYLGLVFGTQIDAGMQKTRDRDEEDDGYRRRRRYRQDPERSCPDCE
jgi:hypothetical protein